MASPEKLVGMANQIGKFFSAQPGGGAAGDIADHIRKFWDPRMRADILAHLEAGGTGLDPPVRAAIAQLKAGAGAH
jgi:formate dehydrogenase subunit delta